MAFPPMTPSTRCSGKSLLPEIHASLDELARLRFKATGFSFLPRQPVHSILSGRHGSRLRGRGLNFEELRHYLPGDDLRTIDWKVTARTRKPHVRVYTEERDRVVWLLVDQRISMFFGSRKKMKSLIAAEAAALSAWRVLAAGDRVGAIVFDDQNYSIVPPHRSSDRVMQILRSIVDRNAKLSADSTVPADPAMLNRVLQKVDSLASHDCLLVLISDGFGLDQNSRRFITRISAHNDVLSLFIYDPLEQALPDAGRLIFADPGGQLEINTESVALRENFSTEFDDRLARMKSTSRRYAIPLLKLSTAHPILHQVRAQLGEHTAPRP